MNINIGNLVSAIRLAVVETAFMCLTAFMAMGQTFNEWLDPEVNGVNRLPMHASFFAYSCAGEAGAAVREESTNYLSLNGLWKFNWVRNCNDRPTDFYSLQYDDTDWDTMRVPAVWELNGYGDPVYVNVGWAWKGHFEPQPPLVPEQDNHVGSYRREIEIPEDWNGKEIVAHIGAAASNLYFWVNGKFVGYSEDSKLEAEFDITEYVHTGTNLFAMQVFRWCDGSYLEDQDLMRYSGIGRDCFIFARERSGIRDIRVTPDLDEDYGAGTLRVEIATEGKCHVALVLTDAGGNVVAKASVKGGGGTSDDTRAITLLDVPSPNKWSAETPYLYTLTATSSAKGRILEVIPVRVGFRKVEIRDSQLLVNGEPVLFKGVDRHEIDPDGGYCVSRERVLQDIRIMKELNINAVRTSHYPDDAYWYELCDEYGIYLVAEANVESHGMGYGETTLAKEESYRKAHLERNIRNVQRNFNHPSVLIWSLGNEAGNGPNFYACYDEVRAEDPSRPVQYERAQMGWNTDIYCPMYLPYDRCVEYCRNEPSRPLILCEYAHAMGNSEGGFAEYWDIIRREPLFQGGFIWDFVDQSPRIAGKDGVPIYGYAGDWNDWDDNADKNFCDNGLVNPDRVWNPHAHEVRHIYQPVWTRIIDAEQGCVEVHNEHFFRDISNYYMDWTVLADGRAVASGIVDDLDVCAQGTAEYCLGYDFAELPSGEELLLNVEYRLKTAEPLLPAGHLIAYQQFELAPYRFPTFVAASSSAPAVPTHVPPVKSAEPAVATPAPIPQPIDTGGVLTFTTEKFTVVFDSEGWLAAYKVDGQALLAEGSFLRPNFWRAPTDNDMGAGLQKKYAVWKRPSLNLKGKGYEFSGDLFIFDADYDMPEVQGTLNMEYVIFRDGTIQVSEAFNAVEGADVPDMFRFGMRLEMPQEYDRVEYYGRGPWENYSDRKASANIGLFCQSVAEQFHPYIRVQETGTRSDLRWWKVLNGEGNGLCFTSNAPFSASALEYTLEALDEGDGRGNTHSPEVEKAGMTCLCINAVQTGLGCVNSWGAIPLDTYLLHYQSRTFTFVISPLSVI